MIFCPVPGLLGASYDFQVWKKKGMEDSPGVLCGGLVGLTCLVLFLGRSLNYQRHKPSMITRIQLIIESHIISHIFIYYQTQCIAALQDFFLTTQKAVNPAGEFRVASQVGEKRSKFAQKL